MEFDSNTKVIGHTKRDLLKLAGIRANDSKTKVVSLYDKAGVIVLAA